MGPLLRAFIIVAGQRTGSPSFGVKWLLVVIQATDSSG